MCVLWARAVSAQRAQDETTVTACRVPAPSLETGCCVLGMAPLQLSPPASQLVNSSSPPVSDANEAFDLMTWTLPTVFVLELEVLLRPFGQIGGLFDPMLHGRFDDVLAAPLVAVRVAGGLPVVLYPRPRRVFSSCPWLLRRWTLVLVLSRSCVSFMVSRMEFDFLNHVAFFQSFLKESGLERVNKERRMTAVSLRCSTLAPCFPYPQVFWIAGYSMPLTLEDVVAVDFSCSCGSCKPCCLGSCDCVHPHISSRAHRLLCGYYDAFASRAV